MIQIKYFALIALLLLTMANSEMAKAQEEQFNLRFNPLIFAIGGNFDFDVYLTTAWTLGPSFFGWGGCGNRTEEVKTSEGSECNTWLAYGVRGNYIFQNDTPMAGAYIGSGLYQVKKSFSYGHSGQSLSGEVSGPALSTIVGYLYRINTWLNVSGGLGGLIFLTKPSTVTVSNLNTQTSISSGPSTQFLAELSLGISF